MAEGIRTLIARENPELHARLMADNAANGLGDGMKAINAYMKGATAHYADKTPVASPERKQPHTVARELRETIEARVERRA